MAPSTTTKKTSNEAFMVAPVPKVKFYLLFGGIEKDFVGNFGSIRLWPAWSQEP